MNRTSFKASLSPLALAVGSLFTSLPLIVHAEEATDDSGVERIQVTASRRLTTTDEIPYNISVLDGKKLGEQGVNNLADLGYAIPGLTVVDTGPRNNKPMSMRGLTVDELSANDQGDNGGTVSVYVNDTPLLVDLKLIDIDHVEVLRGPQGTLYGAGSLGGTLRYILKKPQIGEADGYVGVKAYQVKEADDPSGEVYGAANIPLNSDSFALRVAGSYRKDSGFVDYPNILSGAQKDVDDEESFSGRVALRYAPSDEFDATLTYMAQSQDVGGRTGVNPGFTGDDYSNGLRYDEPLDRDVDLTSLELNWDLEFATLSSSTSYTTVKEKGQRDQTDLLVTSIWPGYADYPDFSAYTREDQDDSTFTQELRLASNDDGGKVLWLVGAYYSKEDNQDSSIEYTPGYPEFIGLNRPDNIEYFEDHSENVKERALFGELTYRLTDQWDLTFGARAFHLEQDQVSCLDFPIYAEREGTTLEPECSLGEGKNSDVIYKASTFYRFTDDFNVYALYSQGFRRGGSNGVPEGGQVSFTDDEKQFSPDTVDNYEMGWHSNWLGGDLSVQGSFYYINWEDIQVSGKTSEGSIPITVNGGKARSQGLELESVYSPVRGVLLTAGYAFTDSKLAEDAPSLDGKDGDRVPGVARHEGNLGATFIQDYGSIEARYSLNAVFKSAVYTRVNGNVGTRNEDNQKLPGFAIVNASATFNLDDWMLRLYADNLLDRYAYVGARGARDYGEQGQLYFINRPLTVGAELQYRF
ncbi:TonB-dependent receptor [Gallaecimonas xiamenensis]|uniref:Tonb-dependent receptor n=1 Tax=Gallaecimonas xiamenensis 3-C-1 TaxID=745411 RepID=K2JXC3_9GAMM|nr:TonB-dependent receptor [Gallaecimonas xiamenensis]EKE69910.1 tonb-dependent receptor [Gallaecimonas xiamenensis 3-C-1]